MNKICTLCKIEQQINQFNKKNCNKDGYQNICCKCSRERSRAYYSNNREKHLTASALNRKQYADERLIFIETLKKKYGCMLCQEKETCCLDFHHIDPSNKNGNISEIARSGYSLKKIINEINKCVCVCSNCHRKIHKGLIKLEDIHRCCVVE